MQSEAANDFSEGFLELREYSGSPITIGGEEISAIVSELELGRDLMEGGFADDGEIRVHFLLSDLSAIPSRGTPIIFNGNHFRVSTLSITPSALVGKIIGRPSKR